MPKTKYVVKDMDYLKGFAAYRSLVGLTVSGTGQTAFLQVETRLNENDYRYSLCLLQEGGGGVKTLLEAKSISHLKWAGAGRLFFQALLSEEDEALSEKGVPLSVFHEMDVAAGETKEVLRLHMAVDDIQTTKDGRFVLQCAVDPKTEANLAAANGDWDEFVKLKAEDDEYFIVEEAPFWHDGDGVTDRIRHSLFVLEEGKPVKLTKDGMNVIGFCVLGSDRVCYYGQDATGYIPTESALYVFDLKTKTETCVEPETSYIYTGIFSGADEQSVIVTRNDKTMYGEYQDEFIDRIELSTLKVSRLNGSADLHIYDGLYSEVVYGQKGGPCLTAAVGGCYFTAMELESCQLHYGDFETGQTKALTSAHGKVTEFHVLGDNIFMVALRGLYGAEVYKLDLKTGEEERLTSLNTHLYDPARLSAPIPADFVNSDGDEVSGWVMKPLHFDPNKKYPAILFIHGGPNAAYGDCLYYEMQTMAAEGFGVMYSNPRGSVGRGGKFADVRITCTTIDYQDLMEFVDKVLADNPWIDEKRLAVTGGSYGGWMTNWMIVRNNRFACAVSDRSTVNAIDEYFLSDIGFSCGIDTYGATPWSDLETVWRYSPIQFAENCKTPTLFIHGEVDYRCNMEHSLSMHTALKYIGVTSRVFMVKGESHGLCHRGTPKHRVRRLCEMVNWFHTYLD